MTNNKTNIAPLFPDLDVPAPPPELRAQVLDRAWQALSDPTPDPWGDLWKSWSARFCWACCVVALLVGHLAISYPRPHPSHGMLARMAIAGDEELAEVISLPALQMDARSSWGSASRPGN